MANPWEGVKIAGFPVKKGRCLRVRHKATGRTAIGFIVADGLMIVQFDSIKFMGDLAYGWHLYPRHHFKRRRRK